MRKYNLIAAVLIAAFLSGCAATPQKAAVPAGLEKDLVTIRDSRYVPLVRIADEYGINCGWDPIARIATLEWKDNRVALRPSSQRILANGRVERLDRPVLMEKGAVLVPFSFVMANMEGLAEAKKSESAGSPAASRSGKFSIRTIVLDAGHGGRDAGAVGRRLGLIEKDYVLKAVHKLKNILESKGIRVIMTRADDRFITLPGRAEVANNANADLFVSLHINASHSRSINGFECYYLSDATDDNSRATEALENSALSVDEKSISDRSRSLSATLWDMTLTENRTESAEVARYICDSVERTRLVRNNGVKSARFFVLLHSRIPSVLVELCYISHGIEEAKLKSPGFMDGMVEAVAAGIMRYKDEYERTEGFTNI